MGWNIAAIIGAVLLVIAGLLASREHRWLRAAQFTEGKVVESIATRGSKGKRTYKPRVEFTGRDGVVHSFVRSYSSSPADFSVGEKVTVAYDAKYEGRIVTFGQRFGFVVMFGALGLALLAASAACIVGRQWVPRIYLEQNLERLER